MRVIQIKQAAAVIVAASTIVAGCSSGGMLAKSKTYDLELNVSPNEVFNYALVATPVNEPAGQKLEIGMEMKVTAVKGDQITLVNRFTGMKQNGEVIQQAMQMLGPVRITQVMDRQGNLIKSSTSGSPLLNSSTDTPTPSLTAFPKDPIKVGDKWSSEVGDGKEKQKIDYEFKEVKTENGREVAVLVASSIQGKSFKTDGPTTFWIDIKSGMPVKTTMVADAGAQGKMNIEMSRT